MEKWEKEKDILARFMGWHLLTNEYLCWSRTVHMPVLFLDVFLQAIFFWCGALSLSPSDLSERWKDLAEKHTFRGGGGQVVVQVNVKLVFAAEAGSCHTQLLQGSGDPRKPPDKDCVEERTAARFSVRCRREAGSSPGPCKPRTTRGREGSKGASTQALLSHYRKY